MRLLMNVMTSSLLGCALSLCLKFYWPDSIIVDTIAVIVTAITMGIMYELKPKNKSGSDRVG